MAWTVSSEELDWIWRNWTDVWVPSHDSYSQPTQIDADSAQEAACAYVQNRDRGYHPLDCVVLVLVVSAGGTEHRCHVNVDPNDPRCYTIQDTRQ